MMIHSLKRGESKRELTKKEKEFIDAGKKFRRLAKGINWGDGDIPLNQLYTLRESFVQKAWILFGEMIAREK